MGLSQEVQVTERSEGLSRWQKEMADASSPALLVEYTNNMQSVLAQLDSAVDETGEFRQEAIDDH